jgi:hypothetical protein
MKRLTAAILVGCGVVTLVVGGSATAQVAAKPCEVAGVTTSNGLVCTKVGKTLVWKVLPTSTTKAAPSTAPPQPQPSTSTPAQLPDPCSLFDNSYLTGLIKRKPTPSRFQEDPEVRTCFLVNEAKATLGVFSFRTGVYKGAVFGDGLYLFTPDRAIPVTSPAGKTVLTVRRNTTYETRYWWVEAKGYNYGLLTDFPLTPEMEQKIIAEVGK